jgi:hypothetical protein
LKGVVRKWAQFIRQLCLRRDEKGASLEGWDSKNKNGKRRSFHNVARIFPPIVVHLCFPLLLNQKNFLVDFF